LWQINPLTNEFENKEDRTKDLKKKIKEFAKVREELRAEKNVLRERMVDLEKEKEEFADMVRSQRKLLVAIKEGYHRKMQELALEKRRLGINRMRMAQIASNIRDKE